MIGLLGLLLSLAGCGFSEARAATYPDLTGLTRPNPEPVLPGYFDAFTPPVNAASPAAGTPVMGEWIRQAAPGDTIPATNDGTPTSFLLYGQTGTTGQVGTPTLRYQDSTKSQLTIPADAIANSMYLLWPVNTNGVGVPVAINGTELWWGNDVAAPGDTASVFGRNFFYGGVPPVVYLQQPGSPAIQAALVAWNNYRIDYQVPASLVLGQTYQVWVHNGHGGEYGWSGPVSIAMAVTVNDDAYWTGTTFNVQSAPYNAKGDGVTDDGPAIQAALTAAAASAHSTGKPATVYLPGGTVYLVNRGFNTLAKVRWMGDGKGRTILRLGTLFADSAMFYESSGQPGHGDNVEIRDMTLDIANNLQGSLANLNGYHLLLETSVNYFKLSNLVIYSGEPLSGVVADSLIFKGVPPGSHAWVQNCDITGGGLVCQAQNQVFVDHCTFRGQYDAGAFAGSSGGMGFSLTNCTVQDYNDGGDPNVNPNPNYFDGRLFAGGGSGDHGLYISGNTTINCAPRVGGGHSGNAGEQILWEGGAVGYNGPITSAAVAQVQIPTASTNFGPDSGGRDYWYAVVVAGKGLGQYRQVTADNGSGLLSVSPNWYVVPDITSTIQVQETNDRAVVYANTLQGKPEYLTSGTSSTGVEPYTSCMNMVIDGNQISQMVTGLYMWGFVENAGMSTGFFDLFQNNRISNSKYGASTNFMNWTGTAVTGTALLGIVMRGNYLNNTASGTMLNGFQELVSDSTNYSPRIDATVVDHNSGAYLATGTGDHRPTDSRVANTYIANPDNNTFSTGANILPYIATEPVSQTVADGGTVTFTAAVSGTPAPTFQWQKNGVNIVGATGLSYTIANVAAADAGRYTVLVTNAVGSVSGTALLQASRSAPFNVIITITVL